MTDQLIPDDLFTRAKVIDGLRQLADYLADHPEVPVTRYVLQSGFHCGFPLESDK